MGAYWEGHMRQPESLKLLQMVQPMGLPFLSEPFGKGILEMDAVHLEISGVEDGAKRVKADERREGCE